MHSSLLIKCKKPELHSLHPPPLQKVLSAHEGHGKGEEDCLPWRAKATNPQAGAARGPRPKAHLGAAVYPRSLTLLMLGEKPELLVVLMALPGPR